MRKNQERKPEDDEEGCSMIPVFTVIKNGLILKNIFVVNNPPMSPVVSGLSSIKFVHNSNQETEEILIVGRHPDCNIVLMHPSISRFHLQINSNPSSRNLFVTDLSSVHGTWISDKKINPGFRIELKEGDTIRMGASTRVYRLHWVPLSRVYDLENPFVSDSDLALYGEKEEEDYVDELPENEHLFATENKNVEDKDSFAVRGKQEATNQAVVSFDSEKEQTQSVYSILEDVVSLFPDVSSGLIMKKEISSPKSVEINSFHDENEETSNSFRNDHELSLKSVGGVILQTLSAIFSDCNQSPEYLSAEEDVDISMMTRLELETHVEVSSDSPKAEESPKSSMLHGEVLPQSKQCQTSQSNLPEIENSENKMSSCGRSEKRIGASNIWSRRGKPATSLQLQTSRSQRKTKGDEERDGAAEWENQENVESESFKKGLFSDLVGMVEEIYTPDKENRTPKTSAQRSLKKNIESKSTTRALFSSLDPVNDENFTPNKENCTPNASVVRSKKKPIIELEDNTTRALFSNLDDAMDDENFTPNKENRTPNTSILRSKKKPVIELENGMITSSDKENQTPQILREMKSARLSRHRLKLSEDIVLKERGAERVPLQSLISNSPMSLSDASFPSAAKRSGSTVSCNQKKVANSDSIYSAGDGRRRWIMIADTTSLLNKEMREALQLLQGLKGTQLIIPRIVIRELDSLKRCNSLFRRKSEASVVLEWIEECMVKTEWWIHVQNSVEEVKSIALTPPATPVSQLLEGSEVFPFLAHGTPMGLVSPTAEDHILDCALLYRKVKNDRQLALLSSNATLKIKAMAEGLICETAQEFRDSLVNPFSERFLWADSSPRGQTWSVFDDIVLKEKYYRSPSKKSSRGEAAKGLKLILLHNSHYVKTV
ncbi:forkhead-associated (FHA) domain-containing protein [Euphorbia peplus]|nr:forkhead-associated (FHA) domain-containing protein [Euphorbia peplus]